MTTSVRAAIREVTTRAAGLIDVEFSTERYDTFAGAPRALSAEAFGTKGVNFRARKPKLA